MASTSDNYDNLETLIELYERRPSSNDTKQQLKPRLNPFRSCLLLIKIATTTANVNNFSHLCRFYKSVSDHNRLTTPKVAGDYLLVAGNSSAVCTAPYKNRSDRYLNIFFKSHQMRRFLYQMKEEKMRITIMPFLYLLVQYFRSCGISNTHFWMYAV